MLPLPSLPDQLVEFSPELGVVLGSGLGFFAEEQLEIVGRIAYTDLDGLPAATVSGHSGQFIYGRMRGRKVICMQGRLHYYEGYSMELLTLPIRLLASLGVSTLVLTNAAGGINPAYRPGDFMLIADHINFLGTNPLIGLSALAGPRFPDMSAVYDPILRRRIRDWAAEENLSLNEGTYLATTGPSFETPAEIRAFATLGADAVGMSTVPEAIVARQQGMSVVGLSCITNAAAGLSTGPLSHEEVAATADRVREPLVRLLAAALALAD